MDDVVDASAIDKYFANTGSSGSRAESFTFDKENGSRLDNIILLSQSYYDKAFSPPKHYYTHRLFLSQQIGSLISLSCQLCIQVERNLFDV